MCQLLGVSSNKSVDIEFSLQEFQLRGQSNNHGFGFAFYNKGSHAEPAIYKLPESLAEQNINEKNFKLESKIIIGHVRLASCGEQTHENTHPFKRGKWCFAHNGTVSRIKNYPLTNFKPDGGTDSEHAFCYLLDRIYEKTNVTEIADTLKLLASEICNLGNFNFLLSDGEYLFAYGHSSLFYTKRKAPFQKVTLKDLGYHLNLKEIKDRDEKAVIIATEPLTKEEKWEQIKGLKIFKHGKEAEL